MTYACLTPALMVSICWANPADGQNGNPTSTLDGIYTVEQARRGAEVNESVCLECHENEEFMDALLDSWAGAPVSMLLGDIISLMPEDNPGTLEPQEYADVLAYIFQLNRFPTGDQEMPSDPAKLTNIVIERPPQ